MFWVQREGYVCSDVERGKACDGSLHKPEFFSANGWIRLYFIRYCSTSRCNRSWGKGGYLWGTDHEPSSGKDPTIRTSSRFTVGHLTLLFLETQRVETGNTTTALTFLSRTWTLTNEFPMTQHRHLKVKLPGYLCKCQTSKTTHTGISTDLPHVSEGPYCTSISLGAPQSKYTNDACDLVWKRLVRKKPSWILAGCQLSRKNPAFGTMSLCPANQHNSFQHGVSLQKKLSTSVWGRGTLQASSLAFREEWKK